MEISSEDVLKKLFTFSLVMAIFSAVITSVNGYSLDSDTNDVNAPWYLGKRAVDADANTLNAPWYLGKRSVPDDTLNAPWYLGKRSVTDADTVNAPWYLGKRSVADADTINAPWYLGKRAGMGAAVARAKGQSGAGAAFLGPAGAWRWGAGGTKQMIPFRG